MELINGEAGAYKALRFNQNESGLVVELPERPSQDLAYVLKLKFKDGIPPVDKFAVVDAGNHYYLFPGTKTDSLVLGNDLSLSKLVKSPGMQWDLVPVGKGLYNIVSLKDGKALGLDGNGSLSISGAQKTDDQVWRIETTFYGLLKITNKKKPEYVLNPGNSIDFIGWRLQAAGN